MSTVSKTIQRAGPLGLYAIARQICRRQPRILMYHRFSKMPRAGYASAETFRSQVSHIKRNYKAMTLSDLAQALFEHGEVPEHAVVLTIDDGYQDFYDVAYPILCEHQVPATFFVTTGFINGDVWLWPDQIDWILGMASFVDRSFTVGPIEVPRGILDNEKKVALWHRLNNYLLTITDAEKHHCIGSFANEIGVSLPSKVPDKYSPCSWTQLREMEKNGIEIGGHTVTHPSLGRVSSRQAHDEIFGAMTRLSENLGVKPRSFCYPNGQAEDYTRESIELVKKAGFSCATVAFSDEKGLQERFALRRHSSGENSFQFDKAVSGLEFLGRRLRLRRFL